MKIVKTVMIAAALSLAGIVPAMADTPVAAPVAQIYAVVDMHKLMNKTDAATALIGEIAAKRKQYAADFNKQGQPLTAQRDDLMKKRATLKEADFMAQRNALQGKFDALERSGDERKHTLQAATELAMGSLENEARNVIADIAKEHGYAAVFNSDSVVLSLPSLDITAEAFDRMNKSGKKLTVDWTKAAALVKK